MVKRFALKGVTMEIERVLAELKQLRQYEAELKKTSKSVAGPSLKNIREALKKKPEDKKVSREPGQRKWSAKDRKATSERMKKYWAKRKASAKKATK
jgi:hypothetical protein